MDKQSETARSRDPRRAYAMPNENASGQSHHCRPPERSAGLSRLWTTNKRFRSTRPNVNHVRRFIPLRFAAGTNRRKRHVETNLANLTHRI